jgi:2,3-bisphosphoglycerate-independent phosphoglycerate mutase
MIGRYHAMDRDKRWDRVSNAYAAIAEAEGLGFPDPQVAVADAYASKRFDKFIVPAVIGDYRGMRAGNGLLCFNFRADRVPEILGAILDPSFQGFDCKRKIALAVPLAWYSTAKTSTG